MGENKDYMTHPDEMGCIHKIGRASCRERV